MTARGTAALALALLAGSLVGCSDREPALDDAAAWRTSRAPVATEGLAWAAGSTVHLADGTTVDTGTPVRAFLVGGDGVFFVPAGGADDDLAFTEAPLWFAAPGGEAEDTGLVVASTGLAVSPDGSALAVLDADTDEGSAVATGDGRELGDGEDPPGAPADPEVSPDGGWRIVVRPGLRDTLVSPSGDEVVPDAGTPRWTLSRWIDDTTVVGVAVDGPGDGDEVGPDDTLTLMTCEVPSGACELVPGTEGELVHLPQQPGATGRFDLRPRTAS